VLNSAYSAHLAGTTVHLPATVAALASNSVGGAAAVAAHLGGQAGAALQSASDAAYMAAFASATHVGVALVLAGTLFVLARMPGLSRLPHTAASASRPSGEPPDALRHAPLHTGRW
jgi:DHA2 family multidrug resistance protein-like MFS transporter